MSDHLPLLVVGIHIKTELRKSVDEILGFGLTGHEVEGEYFLYLSGEERGAVIKVSKGNSWIGDLRGLLRLDLTQALKINVLGGNDLILNVILFK